MLAIRDLVPPAATMVAGSPSSCAAGKMMNVTKRRRRQWSSALVAAASIFLALRTTSLLARAESYDYYNDPTFLPALQPLREATAEAEEDEEDCLRARRLYGKNTPVNLPVINLGLPKIGTTSLQNFFACAGRSASHWTCGAGSYCSMCILDSVRIGLPPLDRCGNYDAYLQIEGPRSKNQRNSKLLYFPQIEMLDEIVSAYPNATYVLTFRSMDGWYRSLSDWGGPKRFRTSLSLKERMKRSNVTGLRDDADGTRDFGAFFCDHVKRVRDAVPWERLVEIDIEDDDAGIMLAETFDADAGCWGHMNANAKRLSSATIERNEDPTGGVAPIGVSPRKSLGIEKQRSDANKFRSLAALLEREKLGKEIESNGGFQYRSK